MTDILRTRSTTRSIGSWLAVLGRSPGTWLPAPAHPCGPSCWRVELHAGPAHHLAKVTVGDLWSDGTLWARRLSWTPEGDAGVDNDPRWLPSFDGTLAFHEEDGGQLELVGRYDPPGGPLGAVLDAAIMRRVAESTLDRFLDGVVERVTAAEPSRS